MGSELFADASRQLTICNACRYCEGYCAVFPAIERERNFDEGTVEYLASLCHDCRECLYACQYAPPHAFAVNIPQVFTEVRQESYTRHARPRALARLSQAAPWLAIRLTLATVALFFGLVLALSGGGAFSVHIGPGAFDQVVPYPVLVTVFLALGALWIVAWALEVQSFWRTVHPLRRGAGRGRALLRGAWDALSLRYMAGGGPGCAYPGERSSVARRWLHHLVMYGFLLDLASTALAAVFRDVLGMQAPYPFLSPVVVLGTVGGIGIIVGGVGLLLLKRTSDAGATTPSAIASDTAFLVTLLLVAVTGMLLLMWRSTGLLGTMLAIHLGCVAAFFIIAPYNKFKHLLFRYAALVRYRADGEA